ncbi:hypothetical protein ACIOJE_34950 [Kitasatospora sp. NPDC087861]|uniref:hypothetical protein n=1 Tax=Kitasatospora sp. NPDC087861 TaxID=3364070 RepID=UPI00382F6E5D
MGLGLVAAVVAALAVPQHEANQPSAAPPSGAAAAGQGEGGPGLPRGTASAFGLDGSARVAGLPRGFRHTVDGAVEAASTAAANVFTIQRMTPTDRSAYLTSAYGSLPAGAEASAATYQQQHGLNGQGQLVDPSTGQVSATKRYIHLCHPELGAYRVVNSSADSASVNVWQVCLNGTVGPDGPDLRGQWFVVQLDMQWKGGDWQVTGTSPGGFSAPPTPPQGTVVTTYGQRAQLLAGYGSGWTLYSDATDKPVAEMGTAK